MPKSTVFLKKKGKKYPTYESIYSYLVKSVIIINWYDILLIWIESLRSTSAKCWFCVTVPATKQGRVTWKPLLEAAAFRIHSEFKRRTCASAQEATDLILQNFVRIQNPKEENVPLILSIATGTGIKTIRKKIQYSNPVSLCCSNSEALNSSNLHHKYSGLLL